jgi:c-di-GMP-binding flagellar brake protein YcgR
VQVHFWHRGYNCENDDLLMPEATLWKATLINISLGGILLGLECKEKCDFSCGQVIGLQFTPLPYEKPILLEGLIRHIQHNRQTGRTFLGIEFLGLQTSWQGKENFKSISKVIKKYSSK